MRAQISKLALPCMLLAGMLSGKTGAVVIETVPVGDPGIVADTTGFGSVAYAYDIGKYEVTAGQYAAFLNSVARTDTHGLYDTRMDYDANPSALGCNIKRSGTSGNYTYSVAPDWANRPVGFVSWSDAARFCNWLTNGQPTGDQAMDATEDGSYALSGGMSWQMVREATARYVIPSQNEWYKAAYFDPAKPGGAGYWQYPTRSDTAPSNVFDPSGTNNANCYANGESIGPPYRRTEVGAFSGSPGPHGTFDQGGNVWEWCEGSIVRGGAFSSFPTAERSTFSSSRNWWDEGAHVGFRVAYIPEPATLTLLTLTGLAAVLRRRTPLS